MSVWMQRVYNRFPHNPGMRLQMPIVCVIAALALTLVTVGAQAQPAPDPRPEQLPYFYDPAPVFGEDQQQTLARDARLVQSSEIPTLVYVRPATPEEADPEAAKAFADDVRLSWGVESETGANDGLVILYSHVDGDIGAGSIVASWGDETFDESGLSPNYVETVLAGNPRTLLNDGHPFEAVVYALRELRYGGIYLPPPPAPVEGARSVAHAVANIAGPLLVIGTVATGVVISLRGQQRSILDAPWRTGAGVAGALLVLAVLSVYGQSRIGIASIAILLVVAGIQAWIWTRPEITTPLRSVPPTTRRMRKRMQLRRRGRMMESVS